MKTTDKADTYSAVRWSAFSRYGAQFVQTAASLLIAKILAPEYFGLMGMATFVTGLARTIYSVGFGTVIVQRQDVDKRLLSTIFWANLALCVLFSALICLTAPLVARVYQEPEVASILIYLSLPVLLYAFKIVPQAVLQKELDFRSLALREIGEAIVTGVTAFSLAFNGFGVWALVYGTVAANVAGVVLLNLGCPFWPNWELDRARLAECSRFGVGVVTTNVFNFFARNADNLIIGVFLGAGPLGLYAFAYKLMMMPKLVVTQVVGRVMFPKLAKIQNDDREIARVTLLACSTIAALAFPMMAGMAIVAYPTITLFLDEEWWGAIVLVQILCPVGALQSLWSVSTQIILAKGRSDLYAWWGIANGLLLVLSFLIGLPWGTVGVAASYGIACVLWVPVSFHIAFQLVEGIELRDLVGSLLPYAALTCFMTLFVFVVQQSLAKYCEPTLSLPVTVLAGALAYFAAFAIARPAAWHTLRNLIGFKRVQPTRG